MNVLIVAASYLPNLGGLQAVASGVAAGLLRRGHSVDVIASRVPRSLPARESLDGVPLSRWTFLAPRLAHLRGGRPELWLAGLAALPLTVARLLRHIARTRVDVVNLQFAGSPALCVLLAHRLRPFPLVVSLHGDDVEGLPLRSASDRAIFRALLRRAAIVTACSRYLAGQALLLAPEAAPRMRVIYNGIAPCACPPAADRLSPHAGEPVPEPSSPRVGESSAPNASSLRAGDTVIEPSSPCPGEPVPTQAASPVPNTLFAAGRFVPKKGFDVLLRALARCFDPTLRLSLAGDGPECDALHALARELRLAERVVFTGALPRADVMAAMCRSSLVVVPSLQEPFGLVALEAMQSGRPVVASAAGGLPEVLAGAEALLVPPGDAAALAAAIDQSLVRLAAQPSYGSLNPSLAARFSLVAMVDGYEQACVDAIAAARLT